MAPVNPGELQHQRAGRANLQPCWSQLQELVQMSEERFGKDQSYLLESSAMRQVHGWSDQISLKARASGDNDLGGCQPGDAQNPALELPAQT